jgi:hypothetical protein
MFVYYCENLGALAAGKKVNKRTWGIFGISELDSTRGEKAWRAVGEAVVPPDGPSFSICVTLCNIVLRRGDLGSALAVGLLVMWGREGKVLPDSGAGCVGPALGSELEYRALARRPACYGRSVDRTVQADRQAAVRRVAVIAPAESIDHGFRPGAARRCGRR